MSVSGSGISGPFIIWTGISIAGSSPDLTIILWTLSSWLGSIEISILLMAFSPSCPVITVSNQKYSPSCPTTLARIVIGSSP